LRVGAGELRARCRELPGLRIVIAEEPTEDREFALGIQ
jgi:hypothetical protein